MSAAWIAYVLLAGTCIAACVLALDAACKHTGLPRRWSWMCGMALTVLLAFVAPENAAPPANTIAALPIDASPPAPEWAAANDPARASAIDRLGDVITAAKSQLAFASTAIIATLQRALPGQFSIFYASVWLVSSAALLFLLVIVHTRFLQARRSWPSTRLHGVKVRVSPTAGPAVVGAVKPDIVVPAWLLQRGTDEQLMVLRHESEHVRARDPMLLASAWVCAVLLPWHPAVWWMLARLRLAVEVDCDARVLSYGAPRQQYGSLLIDLSQQTSGIPLGAAALADRTSQLERRLKAMNMTRQKFATARAGAFALFGLALLASACSLRVPSRAPAPEASPAAQERAAEKQSEQASVSAQIAEITGYAMAPIYFIDGVRVTAEQGQKMPASLISSIETRRPATEGAPSEIWITSYMAAQRAAAVAAANPPSAGEARAAAGVSVLTNPRTTASGSAAARATTAADSARTSARVDSATAARQAVQFPGRDTLPPPASQFVGRVMMPGTTTVTPGLSVTGGNSAGSDVVMQIRPVSVGNDPSTQPMIIVDGVIQVNGGHTLDIPPDRIASIEVVRGAAAVALYGQRAANGVINITTKKN